MITKFGIVNMSTVCLKLQLQMSMPYPKVFFILGVIGSLIVASLSFSIDLTTLLPLCTPSGLITSLSQNA